jgi:hypothetical protein
MLLLAALSYALPVEYPVNQDRSYQGLFNSIGSLEAYSTNMATIEQILYPRDSGNMMTYMCAPWFSGKKPRRDSLGNMLYWLTYPPNAANSQVISSTNPLWDESKIPVLDTLTTIGYDGDKNLYEFLPAYNPLSIIAPEFNTYNTQDIVLQSIHGYPSPRPYEIPDPLGTYCFSIPQPLEFDTPGFETLSSYYYDYCPFNSPPNRDYGAGANSNTHVPLGLAVHQEIYSWDVQNFNNFLIVKYTIKNTNAIDTIYDIAISNYMDNDIKPSNWGSEGASDDKSGYIKGAGYEFAYSFDADYDFGLSTGYIANKILIPGFSGNSAAWYWRVGQGPDDYDPLSLSASPGITANEKYWLSTGRNPNDSFYTPLRPSAPEITEYEQPTANDTRFLLSFFGNQPSVSNPNPTGRLNLGPGESLVLYSVIFVADNLPELKNLSIVAEEFVNNGLDMGNTEGLTCIPYLRPITVSEPNNINLNWISGVNPDHFEVLYKPYSAPASQWQSIVKSGSERSHTFTNLDPDLWYSIKVGSIFNPGPNEIYLESGTQLINYQHITNNDDQVMPAIQSLANYPNPFKPDTNITFALKQASDVRLSVYNIKGQLINTLIDKQLDSGPHIVHWDGRDDKGATCSSGIYYLRLNSDNVVQTRKMLILK